MKRVIRYELFETNSSTTHSLIIMPKDVYKKWEDSDLYVYDGYYKENGPKPDTLYTFDEVVDLLLSHISVMNVCAYEIDTLNKYKNSKGYADVELLEEVEEVLKENYFYTYEDWNGGDWALEEDTTSYTTESGDEIMIRAKYGRDG